MIIGRFRWICAGALALIPILQHYIGVVDNAGTTILAILALYLVLRVFPRLHEIKFSQVQCIAVLAMFFIYKVFDHGTSFIEVAQACMVIGYLLAVALDCINMSVIVKAASCVGATAGVCLVAQYFCYYVLGFHLQLVPTSFLLAESEQWVLGAQTGLVGVNGEASAFYRPSAFSWSHPSFYVFLPGAVYQSLYMRKWQISEDYRSLHYTGNGTLYLWYGDCHRSRRMDCFCYAME